MIWTQTSMIYGNHDFIFRGVLFGNWDEMRWENDSVSVAWHQRCGCDEMQLFSPTKNGYFNFHPQVRFNTPRKKLRWTGPQKKWEKVLVNECFFHLFSGYGFEYIRRRVFFQVQAPGAKNRSFLSRIAGCRHERAAPPTDAWTKRWSKNDVFIQNESVAVELHDRLVVIVWQG